MPGRTTRSVVSFQRPEVAELFAALPEAPRARLLQLRSLIFDAAASLPSVGTLEEALRWGEPSYLTTESKSGTTIRIHWKSRRPDRCALYVHCQTKLVEQYRALYGELFEFEGNRAVLISVRGKLPERPLRHCVKLALTYHKR